MDLILVVLVMKKHSCMFSKYHNSPSDISLQEAYKKLKIKNYKVYSYLDRGSDERQFNYPGVKPSITSIFRSKYGTYPNTILLWTILN